MKSDLTTCPLFLDLNDTEMTILSSAMTERRVEEGMTVFIEHMPGESLYLIETGAVKISKMIAEGEEICLAQLGPQEYFGEMAIVEPAPRAVTARVTKSAVLWSMKKSDFDALCLKHPALGTKLMRNILKVFAQRLRGNDQKIKDLIYRRVENKA